MATALIATSGNRIPTVLGEKTARLPTGGKIRPGIMVLTKKAREYARAQELYALGVEAGHSFEAIEMAIRAEFPDLKSPLIPRNVPWFTVRAEDFANPEIARQILELYGQEGDDGLRRLYRFPVVFPCDNWQVLMPHELAAWTASQKLYWSEYSPDGSQRHCKTYAPVQRDPATKRAMRLFGGRKIVNRAENGGRCEPHQCPEYQARACNLTGKFLFFIPGIASINALELVTHSFYSMNAAIQRFEMLAYMRGGRLAGFLNQAGATFYFTKRLVEVAHIDTEGRPVRVKQWLIELEAPVDVTALLMPAQRELNVIENANAAVEMLEGAAIDGGGAETEPSSLVGESNRDRAPRTASDWERQMGATVMLKDVINAVEQRQVSADFYLGFIDERLGPEWRRNPADRRRVLEEVEQYDSATLIDFIHAS
jgi:hypothetical protein